MIKINIYILLLLCSAFECFPQTSNKYYTAIDYYKGCKVIDSNVIKVIHSVFSKPQDIVSFPSHKLINIKINDSYSEVMIAMFNSYPIEGEGLPDDMKEDVRIFEYNDMQFYIYIGGEQNGYYLFFEDLRDTLIPYKSYYMQREDGVNILNGIKIGHFYTYISVKDHVIFYSEEYQKNNLLWEVDMYNYTKDNK